VKLALGYQRAAVDGEPQDLNPPSPRFHGGHRSEHTCASTTDDKQTQIGSTVRPAPPVGTIIAIV
jgi:hypothetical protein